MFNSQSGNANYLKMRQPSLKLMINRTECLNSGSPNLNNLLAVFVEVFLTIIDPNLTIEMVIQQTDRIIGTIWKIMLQNSLYRILLDCGREIKGELRKPYKTFVPHSVRLRT